VFDEQLGARCLQALRVLKEEKVTPPLICTAAKSRRIRGQTLHRGRSHRNLAWSEMRNRSASLVMARLQSESED
jgi:hypothetical protein